jgi:hypothetical protein
MSYAWRIRGSGLVLLVALLPGCTSSTPSRGAVGGHPTTTTSPAATSRTTGTPFAVAGWRVKWLPARAIVVHQADEPGRSDTRPDAHPTHSYITLALSATNTAAEAVTVSVTHGDGYDGSADEQALEDHRPGRIVTGAHGRRYYQQALADWAVLSFVDRHEMVQVAATKTVPTSTLTRIADNLTYGA